MTVWIRGVCSFGGGIVMVVIGVFRYYPALPVQDLATGKSLL